LTPLFFGWTISLTTDRFATFFQTYGLLSWGWRALRQKKTGRCKSLSFKTNVSNKRLIIKIRGLKEDV
jgi:hypothetical protein